jgi:hypothetical protein
MYPESFEFESEKKNIGKKNQHVTKSGPERHSRQQHRLSRKDRGIRTMSQPLHGKNSAIKTSR